MVSTTPLAKGITVANFPISLHKMLLSVTNLPLGHKLIVVGESVVVSNYTKGAQKHFVTLQVVKRKL